MAKTILVVDDKTNVRLLIRDYLTEQGYHVVLASNGREALFIAREHPPNLTLLDIMMPEMAAYNFIRHYRKEHPTPIILLTAKLEETDKVLGLELGADDYVTKPFGMRELLARIRAVLRRTAPPKDSATTQKTQINDLIFDETRHHVTVRGQNINLTPSEFSLLKIFIHNPGRVFSRSDLLAKLQGPLAEGSERAIDIHIRNLRQKIEAHNGTINAYSTPNIGTRFDLKIPL